MAESKGNFSEDGEGNLKASFKKMVASQNRKKKKSGGFQVMGMVIYVGNFRFYSMRVVI
jgi:hypothetical protein